MLELFPLQKMKIVQLKEDLTEDPGKVFKVMFNPTHYTEKYGVDKSVDKAIGGTDNLTYSSASNETMEFDLMLDATNTNMYLPESLLRNTSIEKKSTLSLILPALDLVKIQKNRSNSAHCVSCTAGYVIIVY